jgi:flagellar basal-body rod modification protein FlgD
MTTATAPTPTLSGVSASSANTQVNGGLQSLTSNFQTFLSLLTTQLQNQDPLSPVDSNAFTQQLVQMSGVQQQLLTNGLLTSLVGAQAGVSGGVNYIGKDVTAAANATTLTSGKANWSYELADAAPGSTLEIDDGNGNAVWKGPVPDSTSGIHDFSWNGKDSSGKQLPDGGIYSLKVSGLDGAGKTVDSQVLIRGTVSAVQLVNGQPYLTMGNSIVPLANVIGVQNPS